MSLHEAEVYRIRFIETKKDLKLFREVIYEVLNEEYDKKINIGKTKTMTSRKKY